MKTKPSSIACALMMAIVCLPAAAQRRLSLDSCRAMAMGHGKTMAIAEVKQEVARNLRKSARTKYLPHISALGTYEYTSKELSLLNNNQKDALSHLGTNAAAGIGQGLSGVQESLAGVGTMMQTLGIPAAAIDNMTQDIQQKMQGGITNATGLLDTEGQKIVDAFRTDTRHIWAGQVMAIQPIFMGGSIVALNRLADINEQFARNQADAQTQLTIYNTDAAYWQVVSLRHKQRLAQSFLEVVTKLRNDVEAMVREGVATKSDLLAVEVKVSEAEMTLQKVDNGLQLSRMLLCQTIGLPVNEAVVLDDEEAESLGEAALIATSDASEAAGNRPELKMLENTVDMARQTTNILKAGNLPQVALMGGYAVSNPNVLNGFEKKFGGFWNVGLLVRVPLWNWGDVTYKVRAAKGATAIATLTMEEAREKMELQISQAELGLSEASKRLQLADNSVSRAEENLRTAQLGFREGVITPTTVMEAQTAWLSAQSQKIDAQIDIRLAQAGYQKATGQLH